MPVNRETITIPIIPIYQVLYPGMRLPLYAFGSQYPELVRECVEQDLPFAVSLGRSRPDSNLPLEPSTVGCIARMVVDTSDTRETMCAVGVSRLHLLSYRRSDAYLVGQARFFFDSEEPVPPLLLDEARACGSELWGNRSLGKFGAEVPRQAEAASYWIAQRLPVSVGDHQELLELRTTTSRLAKEVAILRSLLENLRSEHKSS